MYEASKETDLQRAMRIAAEEDRKFSPSSHSLRNKPPRYGGLPRVVDGLEMARQLAKSAESYKFHQTGVSYPMETNEDPIDRCARLAEGVEESPDIVQLRRELAEALYPTPGRFTNPVPTSEAFPGTTGMILVPVLISRIKRKKGTLHIERMGKAILM